MKLFSSFCQKKFACNQIFFYLCGMKNIENTYESLNHAKYHIRYHFIFSTKYRKPCLCGIEDSLEKILHGIAERSNFKIERIGIDKDHVHMLVKSCPSMTILNIVRRLKQISTRELWRQEEEHLQKFYWRKRVVWTNGYFCSTVGMISENNVLEYIENQG